ncbi:MAG: efflux RND transporter periplasmic adaptor subunit, partial [candidate division Zixibacteria bacterium]|nr:efflux RND transporter periplasmic adaptor subunit [candidate division Zixibacteria bacterium]
KLYADFNSIVKEGQVIAQIDSTFLVQAVHDADASLSRAKAQLAEDKRALDREKALVDRKLDPQANLDAALTKYESDDAALKQAEATLERAKINLAYSTIHAPISGVVINRAVNVGQTVAASLSSPTLYTIANDLRKMQVLSTIGEADIGRISIGQSVTFTVDAYPDDKFNGTISQIRLAPITIQNVVNYTVVIDVNNDQLKLMPGMTANVKVLAASAHDVLRVPNMALRFQPPAELIDSSKVESPQSAPGAADSTRQGHGGRGGHGRWRGEQQGASSDSGAMRNESPPVQASSPAVSADAGKFGVTQTFPQFEKSAYVPSHESGRGRVWIQNASGKLEPVYVLTGLTDGKYTEVTSPNLKAGDQIVLGINSSPGMAAAQTQNPLTGGQQRGPGGGFR